MRRSVAVAELLSASCGPIVTILGRAVARAMREIGCAALFPEPRSIGMEPLEARQLLSAAWIDSGILKVTGNQNMVNNLSVTLSGGYYTAHANSLTQSFAASSVKSIKIIGANYGDRISIASNITVPGYMEGWGGYDTISGGSGNDTIRGGDGNDSIYGNAGNDQLFGDAGNDLLDGGSGINLADGGTGSNTLRNINSNSSGVNANGDTPAITSLQLWNASSNTFIENLTGGETIDLAKTPDVTIVAQVDSGTSSVRFGLDSNSSYRVENSAPFAIAGDYNGWKDLAQWNVSTGSHTVTATPFSSDNAAGSAGAARRISFNVIRSSSSTPVGSQPASGLSISSLQLWNSASNTFIENLNGGETIDLAKTPQITIVAQIGSSTRSVKFALDSNSNYRVENAAPYAIAGDFDNGKDLADWSVSTGSHTVKATPYSGSNASGSAGTARSVSFNVIKSTSGGTTTPPVTGSGGGIVPRDNSASTPRAVITPISSLSIHAGQSIDVHAMNSALNDGSPINARYVWDFGDSGSEFNVIEGFNASHFYANPGSYTVKLTLSNEAGKTSIATMTVNVGAASRKVYYVSPSGNDSNDGLSSSRPIKSWSKAMSKLADNVEILFQGGQTFNVDQTMRIYNTNVVIGSYGGGKATLKWTGGLNYNTIIYLGKDSASGQDTVRNLNFDSIYTNTSIDQGMPQAISVASTGDTILNNTFLNLGYGITTAPQPDGLLVQDNNAPLQMGLREYFCWCQGADLALLGNQVTNIAYGHDVRSGGTDRLLISYNNFANPVDAADNYTNRGTINIHQGDYFYAAHNHLSGGVTSVGPLGSGSGLDNIGARLRYVVFEDNLVDNSLALVLHGTEHYMARNNVFRSTNANLIEVQGYSSQYQRGVVDANLINNTGINTGTSGKFLNVTGPVNGITLANNLYLAPNLATGGNGTGVVYVAGSDLSSFTRITGNVWPNASPDKYAQGGLFYIWPYFANQAGFKTLAEWEAYPQTSNEHVSDVPYNSSTFAPSTSSVANGASGVWPGVFEDYTGALRPASGSWTAGAVEV